MKKVRPIDRCSPSFGREGVGSNGDKALLDCEVFPFIHQRHPVAARAVEQHHNGNRMLRSGGVRNENVISSLLSVEFERFFADLLSSNGREETCDQDQPRDVQTLGQLYLMSGLTFSVGLPSTARSPRSTIGSCIKSGCLTISEMISSSLKSFLLNSSSRWIVS